MVKVYDGTTVPADCLLYFTTPSCKPCKIMAPILEQLPVTFLKVDCEQHAVLASAYNVFTVPALVRLRGGRPVESMFGGKTKEQIIAWLEE
jgi:thioredoxin-like negative regulator of GroEL